MTTTNQFVPLLVCLACWPGGRTRFPKGCCVPPATEKVEFWKVWAAYFKDNPMAIFDLFEEPSAGNVPGDLDGMRSPADWRFCQRGGLGANGEHVPGMQDLVDAVRSTGAKQVIAIKSFQDSLAFQGSNPESYLRDDMRAFQSRSPVDLRSKH